MTTGDLKTDGLTVGELRSVLENDWIPDDLILLDYDDRSIGDINLTIDRSGTCTEVRMSMSS